MGQVLSKLMLQAKTNTKTLLERIWPLLQRGRSGSPSLPDLAGQHVITLAQISAATTSAAPTAQALLAPESITAPEVPGPAQTDPVIASESVRVPSSPTVFSTTESAIKDLAGRSGSDLFPALKVALAALVELAKSWDGAGEALGEFTTLQSKLIAFDGVQNAPTTNETNELGNIQMHLSVISEMVQRLWHAISAAAGHEPNGQPVSRIQNIENIKALLSGLESLLEVFEVDDSVAVDDRLDIVRQRLSTQPHHAVANPPSLSVVNQNGNITYNLGRDVVNNNNVYNYIFAYEAARHTSRLEQHEKAMKTFEKVLGDNFVSIAADDEQPTDAGCMPGTREGVLSQFIRWMKQDYMAIFWLAGMAGTGKTSIALSLCRLLRSSPDVCLASGFFCSRSAGGIARRDVRRVLPTLAALLACQSMEFAVALASELDKDRRIGHKPVGDQIGPLIRTPLAALATSNRPIVFIIDALDELGDEKEVAALLRILADFRCKAKVKFILTSRPEMHIRGTPISSTEHSSILQLHTIEKLEVSSDIRFYLRNKLQAAAPEATWYTDEDVELLVKLSDGLFIFAATVVDFVLIREGDEDRQDRLQRIASAVTNRTAATSAVDKVYELVLTEATKSEIVERDELEKLKRILACVLTARASLSVDALASLINITPGRLRGSLERLHSLVYLPDINSQPGVRTLHASFGDYLFERAHEHILIAPTYGHDILAQGCLRRMAGEDLRFNVSQSPSSFVPNPGTVPDWIPLPLIYACLHWAHHIDAASETSAFDQEIHTSFRPKFLFWLEVLSVIRKTGLASGLLRIAHSAVKEEGIAQFLHDANAFVASSYTAIDKSVPHIYLSALQFATKDSLVYRDFSSSFTGIVTAEAIDIDYNSDQLQMTLTGHEDTVNSVAYSPDGRLLASGSLDGTVRIWDTRTGEEIISPLRVGGGRVHSVAFSPNGQFVASGSRRFVEIWSIETGQAALPPLHGHSNWVRYVSFSPDGTLVASASDDTTVRLWTSLNGREIVVMRGHTAKVRAVVFSPSGRLLASASDDMTVRLWSIAGEAIGEPLTSLQDEIMCLAFSPDGHYLAAGAQFLFEARIWDLRTCDPTPAIIRNHDTVYSLAFSPDGTKLASSGYATVRLWDPHSGRELSGSSLAGHSDWVESVAFSPDGRSLASGSADRTVRIWDVASGYEPIVQQQRMHSGSVNSVAVAPNGAFIVSGSGDHSVRVWDASTGEARLQPLLGHEGSVVQVAISPNGRSIASASADQTVRLWDIKTGDAVGEPLRDHNANVSAVAFSPNGQWLASGSDDKTVHVWDVSAEDAAVLEVLHCTQGVRTVAFSLDGRLLAAGDRGGYLHFWLSGINQRARSALGTDGPRVQSIAFSPDSAWVVVGTAGRTIGVWHIDSEQLVLTLRGHVDKVRSVAYSPKGCYIVSASNDKTVRLWNAKTGASIAILHGHGDHVYSVAFTPDGLSLVSAGADKTIRVWNLEQALSPPSPAKHDPMTRFHPAKIDKDGWLVGSSGELLLWLPPAHRGCIQLPPCTMMIGPYRIAFTADNLGAGSRWGESWTRCWRGGGT